MALSPLGLAQTSTTETPPPPPSSPSPEKKKKVWTEEDLRKIQGGVSVVGEPDKPPAKAKKAAPTESAKAEEALPEEAPERPPCKSWSWAAAVDAVLSSQGVNLGRVYWIQRSYGGEICTTELGDLAALAKRVEGDYVLDDLSKIHIQAEVFTGLPVEVVGVQESTGILHIVVWKGHPYLTTSYTGVRWVSGGITVGYNLQTLTMTDPYEDRSVRLDRATEANWDIQGGVRFTVKPR